jgi:hypothetical protein
LIAGGAAVAAALGGLLLDDGVEDVEKAVQTGNIPGIDLAAAPVDEKTKLALKVAVALLGLVGVTVGELTLLQSTMGRITSWLTCGAGVRAAVFARMPPAGL